MFAVRASLYWTISPRALVAIAFFFAMVLGTIAYYLVCQYNILGALRVGAINGLVIATLAVLGLLFRKRYDNGKPARSKAYRTDFEGERDR